MKLVRGRAEARWLPSRHRFALFRLFAFLRLRNAKPEPREGLILVVDRDQTAVEHHGVSLWVLLTLACYVAATLFASWPLPVAFGAGFLVAAAALDVPIVLIGLLIPAKSDLSGWLITAMLIALAVYFAMQQTWARFAAWQYLAGLAINAVAAAIVFLLRERIARLERGVVSES